jgi:hypothetical protein
MANNPHVLLLHSREVPGGINQGDDPEKELTQLHQIFDVLNRHPGKDSVQFVIYHRERVTRLDLPNITVDYSNGLMSELDSLLRY